ncbi:cytosol nonspecific dipeptidase [Endozoicomonas sp. (ex Bugula neritina AB1)]|nr:cytosol nonspecific dipeptidase [Endozoicomonas sp. (ex Bugula neritina AB1)]
MSLLSDLKPETLWRNFQEICAVPHPSRHEEAICSHMKQFADQHKLESLVDDVGNIIIRKPATAGMENRAGMILQGHLDMVPQKNAETKHNFLTDPIRPYIDGDWVTAEGTTLGADNGIGVAAALALLEASDVEHGPLEVLLTVNEESGMTGVKGLKPGLLQGNLMLNLDSEEEGELCVGCAGGMDVVVEHEYQPEKLVDGFTALDIAITGLKGGHSGQDINLQRGNTNKLMVRLLKALAEHGGRIVSVQGGSLRNAIPREAFASISMPTQAISTAHHIIDELRSMFQSELAEVEPNLQVSADKAIVNADMALPITTQTQWLGALHASPAGVARMSVSVKNVVETSNNLAVITMADGKIRVDNMVRSLVDSAREDHAEAIAGLYRLLGATVTKKGAYPGWKPNMDSTLLKVLVETHKSLFNSTPAVKVIHAGLECGLLGSAYPNWDMISLGPTIRFPHSPDEKVSIPAVQTFWHYLINILKNVPLNTQTR